MNTLPPLLRDQRIVDAEHLNLLAIFHFVVSGLVFAGLAFLALHYMIMSSFLFNPEMWKGQEGGPPPEAFFSIFKWFYMFMALFFIIGGISNLLTGLWIRRRQHRWFSIVIAALNCFQVPFGTILGVFTLIVLMRPSVRELYEAQQGAG